ncbi:MAG: nucleoid-associated protein, partial [Lewinella sp.]|nr:nucleoid-associated protein [Lewinella sp.]
MAAYELHQLAVHEIVKEVDRNECEVFLAEALMPVSEAAERLLHRLYRTFNQKNEVLQGQLASPEDALFPGYFQHLLEGGVTDPSFLHFSREATQALQLSLQGVLGAKGGYLVFAHYTANEQAQVGIYLVRDEQGLVFERRERRFSLADVTYLNVDKMAMAGHLPVQPLGEEGRRPVEVIKHAR